MWERIGSGQTAMRNVQIRLVWTDCNKATAPPLKLYCCRRSTLETHQTSAVSESNIRVVLYMGYSHVTIDNIPGTFIQFHSEEFTPTIKFKLFRITIKFIVNICNSIFAAYRTSRFMICKCRNLRVHNTLSPHVFFVYSHYTKYVTHSYKCSPNLCSQPNIFSF